MAAPDAVTIGAAEVEPRAYAWPDAVIDRVTTADTVELKDDRAVIVG